MQQINILVVDDEKEIAELVEIYLVSDGYKVFKAYNAEEGLQILSGKLQYPRDYAVCKVRGSGQDCRLNRRGG